ncbi:unnamed protein product [Trichogramma brassicae]|uniref:Uncharacterized protein n=1 Tax=Trichogramma brassicae TaxID=86971 RepID=A0A6H5HZ94_9HYME|nr:unnamed protein product [Trichogramma brassicae]
MASAPIALSATSCESGSRFRRHHAFLLSLGSRIRRPLVNPASQEPAKTQYKAVHLLQHFTYFSTRKSTVTLDLTSNITSKLQRTKIDCTVTVRKIVGQIKAPPKRAMPPQDVSCALPSRLCVVAALFPRVPNEPALPLPLLAGAIVPAVTLEELRRACGRIKDHTAPGPDGVPNSALKIAIDTDLTSSCRCTRRACGPVSFQRAEKGRGVSCRQSQASPPKNHRRTGHYVCWTQRARFWKESSVTASKSLLRALGASQIIRTPFGRGDRQSTPSRTSSPPPERQSRTRNGTVAPRSTAP